MGAVSLMQLIEAAERVIAGRVQELDLLDAAIGDGDHGTNLARGLKAALDRREDLARAALPDALQDLGLLIASETGGDGGRLYGAFLRGMASAAPAGPPGLDALARMVEAGVAALREAGGARVGEKTMLDVLEPVAYALQSAVAEARPDPGARLIAAAAHGLHRTSRLPARHGRAAGLGAASVNHLDPGAWSSALLIGALVAVLDEAQAV